MNKLDTITLNTSAVLYDDRVEICFIKQDSDGNIFDSIIVAQYASDYKNNTATFVVSKEALSDICDIINKKK